MGRVYSRRRKTKSKKRDFITEDTERQRGAKKQGRHGRRPDISEGAPKVRKNQYVARRCVIAKLGRSVLRPYGAELRPSGACKFILSHEEFAGYSRDG